VVRDGAIEYFLDVIEVDRSELRGERGALALVALIPVREDMILTGSFVPGPQSVHGFFLLRCHRVPARGVVVRAAELFRRRNLGCGEQFCS